MWKDMCGIYCKAAMLTASMVLTQGKKMLAFETLWSVMVRMVLCL
jgi:hypothetical protein